MANGRYASRMGRRAPSRYKCLPWLEFTTSDRDLFDLSNMYTHSLLFSFLPTIVLAASQSYAPTFFNPNQQDQICLPASWPSSSSPGVSVGKPLVPQFPNAELQALLQQVNTTNIEKTILKLVSFGTRHTLSSQTDPERGIGAARDWIVEKMEGYGGGLGVSVQTYLQGPTTR